MIAHSINTFVMPRLSLYKPEKSADYRFLDRNITEMFQVGGTDVFVHKYLGPVDPGQANSTPTQPAGQNVIPETKIQDLLFLENRDRKYSEDVYTVRGIYQVQDIDFDLSQFGMFLQNDTVFITFPLNHSVELLGRKLMSGDVLELPHLKDENALNDFQVALKRFYVVEDVTRSAEGFSQTWYPHLLRAKCKPILDSQEFKEIFDKDSGEGTGSTIRDVLYTYEKEMQINQAIIDQAEEDAPKSGYDTNQFFVVPTDSEGAVNLKPNGTLQTPSGDYYIAYGGRGTIPPNGAPYTFGASFPSGVSEGSYHLRTDYLPNRLFRYDGTRWVKIEDGVRVELTENAPSYVAGFVNNTNTNQIGGETVEERQSLSEALKPKADN